mgnify:CR=1 FL=1
MRSRGARRAQRSGGLLQQETHTKKLCIVPECLEGLVGPLFDRRISLGIASKRLTIRGVVRATVRDSRACQAGTNQLDENAWSGVSVSAPSVLELLDCPDKLRA